MTNFDVFAQIISEASGRSLEEVKTITDIILKMAGSTGKMYETIPDEKAQEMLTKLRSELPGIRQWLIEGGLMMEADLARDDGKIN